MINCLLYIVMKLTLILRLYMYTVHKCKREWLSALLIHELFEFWFNWVGGPRSYEGPLGLHENHLRNRTILKW